MERMAKANKARKKRHARERAKALRETASRQQDEMYYGSALNFAERNKRGPFALSR